MLRINPDPKKKRSGYILWPLGISLGIYPGAARDIAWDLSGGRSGNRLGFFRWPLRRSPSIFGIALGVSEHVPRHFPCKIPGDLDIRSKAMERHVTSPNNLEYLLAVSKNLAHPLHPVYDDGKGGGWKWWE